jgi:TorA maturation chaperone TorD
MREGGLEAIRAAISIGVLPKALGVQQPAVPLCCEISPARVFPAKPTAGVPFSPDRHPMDDPENPAEVDEVDLMRAHQYGLLALLFGRAPSADLLARVAELKGDATPLGLAHIRLAEAAAASDPDAVSREFFDLFIGVARGDLLPYASYYLTGFLHERPLARVREDLARLGIERVEELGEPEDHIAILCEVMSGLVSGRFGTEPGAERGFFDRHLKPWSMRFFADCETAPRARFYRAAGAVGRLFLALEAEAFAMDA